MRLLIILGALLLAFTSVQASDLAKEQRWREQVVGDLFDGEPLDLNDGKTDFLALLTEPGDSNGKAVIVMHGIGVHPDWPQIINPLRVQLAEDGWTTLSIQLPVLVNDAEEGAYEPLVAEASPRIDAALAYFQEQGFSDIYLVAHSLGARMAAYYLANHPTSVSGFVGVGMNVGTVEYMGQIKLPVLDLYGSEDLGGVLESAGDRAQQAANNPNYTQRVVDGADHFFDGMEGPLYAEVSGWLEAQ